MTTLAALINKTKTMEDSRNKMNHKKAKDNLKSGKRPFSFIGSRGFEKGSRSGGNKKFGFGKCQTAAPAKAPTPGQQTFSHPKGTCKNCLGPHLDSECKWTPGECFACGKVGH